jgi:hypothetical protein
MGQLRHKSGYKKLWIHYDASDGTLSNFCKPGLGKGLVVKISYLSTQKLREVTLAKVNQ